MTTASATLVPPAGLVTTNSQGKTLFSLFTQDWLSLQTFIVQALALPITTGDFEAKYGKFQDQQEVESCISAMRKIQGLSQTFGDPKTLVQELANNPAILESATAPQELYTHIVWFATKLYQAATTYNQTLQDFLTVLNPSNCGDQTSCAAVLKDLLVGNGGLQSTAVDMVSKCNLLIQSMASFEQEIDPAVTEMTSYTAESSKFYNDVKAAITVDTADIKTYQAAAASAYKEWRDYTIAATTTSIGVLVLSAGLAWPASAILGGVLGDKAAKARKAYDKAKAELRAAETDQQEKILLEHDLSSLNTAMAPTSQAATAFKQTLEQVLGVWTNVGSNIAYIADTFTPDKLGSLSWVQQALDLDKATKDWHEIAQAAEDYTANSLVSFTTQEFGSDLPPVRNAA